MNFEVFDGKGSTFPAVEPSVAVSGKDSRNIVAGCVLDWVGTTFDSGQTWLTQRLKSQHRIDGDPAIISDSTGRFYFFHLATPPKGQWPDRIVCQRSLDGGKTWDDGSTVGFNPPTVQDKAWPAIDPRRKDTIYASWTQFDKYGSKIPTDHSIILFGSSKDAGLTWSKPVQISDIPGDCVDGSNSNEGAVPAVSSDGTIYVTWSCFQMLFLNRSRDGGKTWLKHNIPICRDYGGWDMALPGLDRSNGMPVLQIDNSHDRNHGSLYLVWADQRHGVADTDIFFSRSADKGETWSPALRINQDGPGKQQFLPWMSVDQKTGYIYVVYYDRRAYSDLQTDVYLAYSTDGGRSFQEQKISESPFTPDPSKFFGDYTNVSANNGVIVPIWSRMDNGHSSVWSAVIRQEQLLGKAEGRGPKAK